MATSDVHRSIQQLPYRYALLLRTVKFIDRVLGSVFKHKSEVSVTFMMYVQSALFLDLSYYAVIDSLSTVPQGTILGCL
jgi:hypothetical protein